MSENNFRKKPIVIQAVQFNGNTPQIEHFMGAAVKALHRLTDGNAVINGLIISTLEGDMRADLKDWIIKGVQGEFYPCKPDIFASTYEPASAPIPYTHVEVIPSKEENPTGFHKRYQVSKVSGDPVDVAAEYMVLRLDWGGDDQKHIMACRIAARAYAEAIKDHLPDMSADIFQKYPDESPIPREIHVGEDQDANWKELKDMVWSSSLHSYLSQQAIDFAKEKFYLSKIQPKEPGDKWEDHDKDSLIWHLHLKERKIRQLEEQLNKQEPADKALPVQPSEKQRMIDLLMWITDNNIELTEDVWSMDNEEIQPVVAETRIVEHFLHEPPNPALPVEEAEKKVEEWEWALKTAIYTSLLSYVDDKGYSIPCKDRDRMEGSILKKFKGMFGPQLSTLREQLAFEKQLVQRQEKTIQELTEQLSNSKI